MKKVQLEKAKPYVAPGHFNMVDFKLHSNEETGSEKFWMGLSYLLPGGGAEYSHEDSSTENIFFVLDGEVTFKTKNEEITLGPKESVYIPNYEGREIINRTNKPASMLIVVNY